jgi:hypothetical protein
MPNTVCRLSVFQLCFGLSPFDRRHCVPKVNGCEQVFDIHEYNREQIQKWLEFHRTRNGDTIKRLLSAQHTDNPSVQGVWTPFTNKATSVSVARFASDEYRVPYGVQPSGTEQVAELYSKQFADVKNVIVKPE